MAALFHILARSDWRTAVARGVYRPGSVEHEGFVHCSFAGQVEQVANARFRDSEDLWVVELDPVRVGAPVVVEDSYGSGTAYPHVYGSIPTAAAVALHRLTRSADGGYLFTVPGAAGRASSDR